MKNKFKIVFFTWWFLALLGNISVWHYDMQYDANGVENFIWWGTFFISFPFELSGEIAGELLPDAPGMLIISIAFVLGTLLIFLIYCSILWILEK